MKKISVQTSKNNTSLAIDKLLSIEPSVVLLFGTPVVFKDKDSKNMIIELSQKTKVIGCSTAGEISNEGLSEDGIAAIGIHFEHTEIQTAYKEIRHANDSIIAGASLAKELHDPDLKGIIIFGPGQNVNGSGIIEGLRTGLSSDVLIFGGLAADEWDFNETFTVCDGQIFNNTVVALGLYGDHVSLSCGSNGGWRPFGPARRVTRSNDNILQELDHKPALQLYKHYLGEKAQYLPASGISYPFAILKDDRSNTGLIRSALEVDHDNESLVLAGDIPEGCQVCLMHADAQELAEGSKQAAIEALRTHKADNKNGLAIFVSCMGRREVMGFDVDDEIEAAANIFPSDTDIIGFYSYGEICSYEGTGQTELHNQTMTISYITEEV